MEYKKAILRPFQDWNKFLIGFLLLVVPFLNLITGIFVRGYGLDCAKESMKGKNKLPKFEMNNFIKGLMSIIISIIYILPVAVVVLIFGGITGAQAIIYQDFTNLMIGNMIFGIVLAGLLFLLILYILPMALMSYVEKWNFKDAFNLKKVFRKSFNLNYLEVILVYVGYVILISFASLIFSIIPYVGSSIGIGISGYIFIVTGNSLFGEIYKKIK